MSARWPWHLDSGRSLWQRRINVRLCSLQGLAFYEFNTMPFGLCNAPAMFERIMENCAPRTELDIVFGVHR
jgi:hypothetical protein